MTKTERMHALAVKVTKPYYQHVETKIGKKKLFAIYKIANQSTNTPASGGFAYV